MVWPACWVCLSPLDPSFSADTWDGTSWQRRRKSLWLSQNPSSRRRKKTNARKSWAQCCKWPPEKRMDIKTKDKHFSSFEDMSNYQHLPKNHAVLRYCMDVQYFSIWQLCECLVFDSLDLELNWSSVPHFLMISLQPLAWEPWEPPSWHRILLIQLPHLKSCCLCQ